jgi:hypothetical protein
VQREFFYNAIKNLFATKVLDAADDYLIIYIFAQTQRDITSSRVELTLKKRVKCISISDFSFHDQAVGLKPILCIRDYESNCRTMHHQSAVVPPFDSFSATMVGRLALNYRQYN